MALAPYILTVITRQDAPYNVVPNAPIEIRARLSNGTSGALSLIYEDQQGLTPITQTGALADANGQFVFYAEANEYNAVYQGQTVPVDVGVTVANLINDLKIPAIYPTVSAFKLSANNYPDDKIVITNEKTIGNKGGATWKVVRTVSVTPNNKEIVQSTAAPLQSIVAVENIQMGQDDYINAPAKRDAFYVGRTVNNLTDIHGYADRTEIAGFTDSGTYGSFDAVTYYNATQDADHLYTFQGRGRKDNTGALANYASFYSQPDLGGTGLCTDVHHVRVYNPNGTAPITNHHGIHIRPLDRGVNNFAIFSWGDTPSIHVGKVTIGDFNLDTAAALSVKQIFTMTGVYQAGIYSGCGGNSAAIGDYAGVRSKADMLTEVAPYSTPIVSAFIAEDAGLSGTATADAQYGFYAKDQTKSAVNAGYRSHVSASPTNWNAYFTGDAQNYFNGKMGLGLFQPTAKLDVKASDGVAGNAPIKLNAGVNLATAENGAIEFDGTNLYITISGVRKTITVT